MVYLKAFVVGVIFMFAGTFQQTNSAKNRWHLAFPTSIIISCCTWVNVHYVATNSLKQFIMFGFGTAIGSTLGIYYGHRHRG